MKNLVKFCSERFSVGFQPMLPSLVRYEHIKLPPPWMNKLIVRLVIISSSIVLKYSCRKSIYPKPLGICSVMQRPIKFLDEVRGFKSFIKRPLRGIVLFPNDLSICCKKRLAKWWALVVLKSFLLIAGIEKCFTKTLVFCWNVHVV